MKKLFAFAFLLFLMIGLCACGVPTKETPKQKTSVAIADLAEGTYVGTLSEVENTSSNDSGEISMTTTIESTDIKVTIKNGQIDLYSKSIASAVGKINGKETPKSPEYDIISSASLTLKQSDNVVIAEGEEEPRLGHHVVFNYKNGKFTNWKVTEIKTKNIFSYVVRIAMKNGKPVANITMDNKKINRTADVTLELKNK